MKTFVSTLLAILTISFGSANAALVTIETYNDSSNQYINIEGNIDKNTPDELTTIISNNSSIKSVRLNSPGGIVNAGWKLATIIRGNKLNTIVGNGKCVSACTYAFMGGIERKFWKENGKLGYHPTRGQKFEGDLTLNDIYDYGQSAGIKAARRFLRYVKDGKEWQMILFLDRVYSKTSYKEMYWATADELVKAGIVTRVFEPKVSEEVVKPIIEPVEPIVKPTKPAGSPDSFDLYVSSSPESGEILYTLGISFYGQPNTTSSCDIVFMGSPSKYFTMTTDQSGFVYIERTYPASPYVITCGNAPTQYNN